MKNKKKYVFPILSFIAGIALFVIIMTIQKIVGYGNYTIAVGDLNHQYLDFIAAFMRVLKGEESFWYSFSNYLGSGSILTYAYYTINPFNLFFLLDFMPITEIAFIVIALKIGCIALCFYIFCRKVIKNNEYVCVIFSLLYALSAYVITWHFNIMWLDVVYIFPILIMLIKRFIDDNKYLMLILCYAYLFITNFYMGYIAGVSSAVFFLLYLLYKYAHKVCIKTVIKKTLLYAFIVVLSIGICAAILVPTAFFLFGHMASDNFSFISLTLSLADIVNSMFIGEMMTLDNTVPQLYCGILVLLLFPLYFLNKKITHKEKIFTSIGAMLLIISCIFLPLYKFMHAFDYPNFYGYRFAFVMVFGLVTIAAREVKEYDNVDNKYFIVYGLILVVFYSVMIHLQSIIYPGTRINSQKGLLVNGIFIFAWCLLIYLRQVKKVNRVWYKLIVCLVLCGELVINGVWCTEKYNSSRISENDYNQWYYSEKNAIETIKNYDDGLYRVQVNNNNSLNAACMFGYGSFTTFSSSDDYDLRMALSHLGMAVGNRYIESFGRTDVLDMLLAAKYYVFEEKGESIEGATSESYVPAQILQNENALEIGYMVSGDILNYEPCDNPFENQEQLLLKMTGSEYDFYKEIPQEELIVSMKNLGKTEIDDAVLFYPLSNLATGGTVTYEVETEEYNTVYGCFPFDEPGAEKSLPYIIADHYGPNESVVLSYGCINEFYEENNNFYMNIFSPDNSMTNFYYKNAYFSYYDGSKLRECYEDLASKNMRVIINEGELIAGIVNSSCERDILFTSIPYDECWNVYIDDILAEKLRIVDDAFIGIRVPEGEHTIVLQYVAKGSPQGMIISIVSVFVYCIMCLIYFLNRKNINQ